MDHFEWFAGATILRRRGELGLTRKEMSLAINVSVDTIVRIEQGNIINFPAEFAIILDFLSIDLQTLLRDEDESEHGQLKEYSAILQRMMEELGKRNA